MRFGIETKNQAAGNITIDPSYRAFVYIGKLAIPTGTGARFSTVNFTCNGTPQIYFDVPYQVTGTVPNAPRVGIALARLNNLGGSSWQAIFVYSPKIVPLGGGGVAEDMGLYMRVFGRLDLNPPARPYGYGLMVRALDGAMLFYSGKRMLRQAGNTYDTQIVLPVTIPAQNGNGVEGPGDTYVDVSFNMSGKSILATTRGTISGAYYQGTFDNGEGVFEDYYDIRKFNALYWATGSRLWARRVTTDQYRYITQAGSVYFIDNSRRLPVYSRLSVIDNSLFP
jgi:hypothetical protein